ncbi:hypothetical protein D3C73_1273390 [compost metagenome]
MVDQRLLPVDHVEVGAILVVVLAQQAGEHAGGFQVDAAGDKAEKAPVRREHRIGEADEVVARKGDEGI